MISTRCFVSKIKFTFYMLNEILIGCLNFMLFIDSTQLIKVSSKNVAAACMRVIMAAWCVNNLHSLVSVGLQIVEYIRNKRMSKVENINETVGDLSIEPRNMFHKREMKIN